ncbi:MAG TPA: mechanosensitive ion channel domain-containing protein [archaeon]|nr:mechanosensitive ion channel domain-containing protein [archaeon]
MVSFFGLEFDLVSFGFLLAELFVLWLAFRVLDSVVHRKFSTRLKKSELFLARKVMRFAFGLAGVYAILVTFSVEPGDLVFSTTILAAAITLSASTFVGNLIAGVYVVISKPFQYGDTVKIANYVGRVYDVGLMSTKLLTWEKELVTFPSTMLMSNPVVNFEAKETAVRDNFEVKIPFKADVERARKLLQQAVLDVAKKNKSVLLEEKGSFEVQVSSVMGGGVTLLLVFTVDEYKNTFRTASDLRRRVKELFDREKIQLL